MSQVDIYILIGNILNGIGLFFVALSMGFKRKNAIFISQSLNQVFSGAAYLLLALLVNPSSFSGFMLCVVTLTMNIFILFDWQNRVTSIIFALLTLVLGLVGVYIATTNDSFKVLAQDKQVLEVIMSVLPVLGTTLYNVVALNKKSPMLLLRITFMLSCLLWAIFSLHIKSYVGFGFNIVAIIINIVRTVIITKKDNMKQENEYQNQESSAN
jgi:hypothetical protein